MRLLLLPAAATLAFAGGTAQASFQNPEAGDVLQPAAPVGHGFAPPTVTGDFRALRVEVRNTAGQAIDVAIAASDGGHPYRAARRTIAAGATVTVMLEAPSSLQRLVARRARRSRIVRRPAVHVMNLVTNASVLVTPQIRVARGAR